MLSYPWTALVTVAALILYFVVTLNVGRARFKYNVSPPAISGNPDFERVFRVQQNTVEQIVLFIPALWVFSLFVSQIWGGRFRGGLGYRSYSLCLGLLSSAGKNGPPGLGLVPW